MAKKRKKPDPCEPTKRDTHLVHELGTAVGMLNQALVAVAKVGINLTLVTGEIRTRDGEMPTHYVRVTEIYRKIIIGGDT
jgi:hypothetical protein